jgi:hypothetical protein
MQRVPIHLASPLWPSRALAGRTASGEDRNAHYHDATPEVFHVQRMTGTAPHVQSCTLLSIQNIQKHHAPHDDREARAERGFCTTHRPIGLGHLSREELSWRRAQRIQLVRKACSTMA